MNRAAVIEQLKQTRTCWRSCWRHSKPTKQTDSRLILPSRRKYRRTCERPNKGNKAIERDVLSRYQVAQSLGFNGDFRAWEHLRAFTSENQATISTNRSPPLCEFFDERTRFTTASRGLGPA
jgi:hypothetical protein